MAIAKKVYAVEVSVSATIYVLAADRDEADKIAFRRAGDVIDDEPVHISVDGEVTPASRWVNLDDVPYGDNPRDLTIRQIFEQGVVALPVSEEAGPVHWCVGCLQERVQYDWRKEVQLCPACETAKVAA